MPGGGTQTAAEILIAAGKNVYTGVVGSTAPTNATSPPAAAYKDIGHISTDGIAIDAGGATEDVLAWTAAVPVRTFLTGREFSLSFALLQWNTLTMQNAFGGGSTSGGAGPYVYTFPADNDVLPEYALIIDWVDGVGRDMRLFLPRVVRQDNVSVTLARTEAAALAIAFKKLASAPAQLLTADSAFG
jgi:hypothetical protein